MAIYDFSVAGIDNNFSCVVIARRLVLNNDLVFTWLNVAREAENIRCTFPLPLFNLLFGQSLTSLNLIRYLRLRHITNEHFSLWEGQIFFEPAKPILFIEHADSSGEGIFHALRDLKNGLHGTLTLSTESLFNIFFV